MEVVCILYSLERVFKCQLMYYNTSMEGGIWKRKNLHSSADSTSHLYIPLEDLFPQIELHSTLGTRQCSIASTNSQKASVLRVWGYYY